MEKNTDLELQNNEAPLSREAANEVAFAAYGGDFGNSEKVTSNESATEAPSLPSEDKIELPSLEAPAQWRKERKEAWSKLPREDQEEILRVTNGHDSKLAELHRETERFKTEKAKYEPYEQLISEAQRFARANGEQPPSPAQVVAGIRLANDLRGQKASAIVDVLEAQGLPVPEKLREAVEAEGPSNELSEKKITELIKNTIQEANKPLYEKIALEEHLKYRNEMSGHWDSFRQATNDAGGIKYLDIQSDEDPRSLELQSAMAHLVAGQTDFSKQFIASETARNPNITQPELFARAYEFYGGRVDSASRAPSPKANLHRAHRAAASSPGRGTSSTSRDSAPKGLTREQANEYAYKRMIEDRG